MANISIAYGTFIFDDDFDFEQKRNFIKVMEGATKWGYGTYLSIYEEGRTLDVNEEQLSFSGSGRWSYATNLKNLHDWLVGDMDNEEASVYQELLSYMKLHDKSIFIDYTDEESGNQMLLEATGVLNVHYDEESDENRLVYQESSTTHYEYTRSNLHQLNYYSDFEYTEEDVIAELEKEGYPLSEHLLNLINMTVDNNPFAELEDLVDDVLSKISNTEIEVVNSSIDLYEATTYDQFLEPEAINTERVNKKQQSKKREFEL